MVTSASRTKLAKTLRAVKQEKKPQQLYDALHFDWKCCYQIKINFLDSRFVFCWKFLPFTGLPFGDLNKFLGIGLRERNSEDSDLMFLLFQKRFLLLKRCFHVWHLPQVLNCRGHVGHAHSRISSSSCFTMVRCSLVLCVLVALQRGPTTVQWNEQTSRKKEWISAFWCSWFLWSQEHFWILQDLHAESGGIQFSTNLRHYGIALCANFGTLGVKPEARNNKVPILVKWLQCYHDVLQLMILYPLGPCFRLWRVWF